SSFAGESPNPGGLLGQMWVDSDRSGSATNGNVYLLASVQPFAVSDPLDVHFARSTDGGVNWEEPIRINDDTSTTNWQWFGTMSVAPNGRIDVVWLDTRDNPGTFLSALYYSFSMDGGETWSVNERLSEAFDPHLGWPVQQKMGDYFHMVSDDAGASLAWAGTFNGEEDVYFARIYAPQPSAAGEALGRADAFVLQNFPNPFKHFTNISYSISEASHVELAVFNQTGAMVRKLVDERQGAGQQTVRWDGKDEAGNEFPAGIAFLQLTIEKQGAVVKKMVRIK
ncbi:MAG: FlgD immunoglobulin-like domain containing protein, partial [Bacteroidota bacterium]